jgi:hypothetical protein
MFAFEVCGYNCHSQHHSNQILKVRPDLTLFNHTVDRIGQLPAFEIHPRKVEVGLQTGGTDKSGLVTYCVQQQVCCT